MTSVFLILALFCCAFAMRRGLSDWRRAFLAMALVFAATAAGFAVIECHVGIGYPFCGAPK